jgi:hypothetical protein
MPVPGRPTVLAKAAERLVEDRVPRASNRKYEIEDALSALTRQEMQLTEAFTVGDLSPNLYQTRSQELRDRRTSMSKELEGLPLSPQALTARVAHTIGWPHHCGICIRTSLTRGEPRCSLRSSGPSCSLATA